MGALLTILNLVACGLGAVLGTGTKGCKQIIKKTTCIWLTPDGFEFDGAETLDADYIRLLQSQGNLIVLKGAKTFTDNSSEDVFETLEDGTKQLATLGMYEFALSFINGLAFNAALHSLNSFGAYNAVLIDRDGNILGTKGATGSLQGFSLNYLQAMKLSFATDAVGQKEGIGFQFATRSELDSDYVYIQQEQLGGFQPQKVDGINEVVLSYNTIPVDAATSIVVNAKMKQNQKPLTGADDLANFVVKVNGTTVTPTGVSETADGQYTFVVSALSTNDTISVQLYNTADSLSVIVLDTDLYKSNNATTVTLGA